ncbi:MAG TPA: hypothetical protein VGH63_07515 [Polyangia bacterium]
MRKSLVVAAAAFLVEFAAFAQDAPRQSATAPSTAPAATTPANPAPPPPADPATAAQTNANGSYTVRLHDLERRVNELKEQIFRSKARLNLLKETVLHGVIAGSRAIITHRNEMGSMYTPIRYVYALDGQEIYSKTDESGKMGDQKEIEVFNGSITPGNHTLSVQMVYQGNGYGVFSYLKGYKFTAKSSRTFTAPEGKQLQLKVVGFEKGNPVTTDPKDRPAVDFREALIADKDTVPKSDSATPAPGKK